MNFASTKIFADAAEVHHVVRAQLRARLAVLRDELAVLRELEHVTIGADVAAHPDEAFVIDKEPMVGIRPVEALARAAPRTQQVSVRVEFEHGRRGLAALGDGRILLLAHFVDRQSCRRGAPSRRGRASPR